MDASSSPGARVITMGQVMSGPASPGQQVCTGSWDKSGGASAQALGAETNFGRDCRAARAAGNSLPASAMDRGGCGERIQAMNAPSRSRSAGTVPSPAATRSRVPNRLAITGKVEGRPAAIARSKRSTGPPVAMTRRCTSVISRFISTGAVMVRTSPLPSR